MAHLQYPKYAPNEVASPATSNSHSSFTFSSLVTLGSITTNGVFPVRIELIDGSIYGVNTTSDVLVEFAFFRDSTQITTYILRAKDLAGASNRLEIPASLFHRETPAAGTYVYSLQAKMGDATSVGCTNVKMIAYEMSLY